MLAEGIRNCTGLTSLSLTGNVWDSKGVTNLASVLQVCTQLQVFRLSGKACTIEDGKPDCVAEGIRMCPDLRELELSGVLSGERAGPLFDAIQRATCLRILALTSGGLGFNGGKLLSRLPLGRFLTSLNLAGNAIDKPGLEALAGAMNTSMTALGLNKNALGDEGAASLAQVVRELPELNALHVRDNGITERGVLCVCQGLGPSMLRLSVGGNALPARPKAKNRFKALVAEMLPACALAL